MMAVFAGLAVSSFSSSPLPSFPLRLEANGAATAEGTVSRSRTTVLPESVAAELDAAEIPAVAGPRQSDLFPDVALIDHTGQQHFFRSQLVSNKVICFAMFYTQCRGTCPGTITKMLRLRRSLTEEFGKENLHFICLTLDPVNDQPEVLGRYASALGIEESSDLAPIYFCTGLPENVDVVRRALGMYDPDPAVDADISQHAAKIVFGNDLLNRWSGMPAGLPVEDLHETVLRIAGTSNRQRFSARLAIDGRTQP